MSDRIGGLWRCCEGWRVHNSTLIISPPLTQLIGVGTRRLPHILAEWLSSRRSEHSRRWESLLVAADEPSNHAIPPQFEFRGMDLETLLELSHEEFAQKVNSRQRRRLHRGLNRRCKTLMTRLIKDKKGECFFVQLRQAQAHLCRLQLPLRVSALLVSRPTSAT